MAPHNYSSGPGNSAGYISSGRPWLTGSGPGHGGSTTGLHTISHGYDNGASSSFIAGMFRTDGAGTAASPAELRINFPYVTKSINVITSGSSALLRIHFDTMHQGGQRIIPGNHFIQLDGDEESFELSTKCSTMYLSTLNTTTGFQLYAELTNIPTGSMYTLTGSGISE